MTLTTAKWAGRDCNIEILGVPCYVFCPDELGPETIAALEDAVERAREGGYRRWYVEKVDGSGGYSVDFPAEWDVLRVMQEVAYVHGDTFEARPARHFEDGHEIPTGTYNWFRPWDVRGGPRGHVGVNWPRPYEGEWDLLAPTGTVQTELFA